MFDMDAALSDRLGISRNIVECKCKWSAILPGSAHRISRNIVECKFDKIQIMVFEAQQYK